MAQAQDKHETDLPRMSSQRMAELVERTLHALDERSVEEAILDVVHRSGRLELGAVVRALRQGHPEATLFLISQGIAHLYRRGLIRMQETIRRSGGTSFHTALLVEA